MSIDSSPSNELLAFGERQVFPPRKLERTSPGTSAMLARALNPVNPCPLDQDPPPLKKGEVRQVMTDELRGRLATEYPKLLEQIAVVEQGRTRQDLNYRANFLLEDLNEFAWNRQGKVDPQDADKMKLLGQVTEVVTYLHLGRRELKDDFKLYEIQELVHRCPNPAELESAVAEMFSPAYAPATERIIKDLYGDYPAQIWEAIKQEMLPADKVKISTK